MLSPALIAPSGHSDSQAPQEIQSSEMKWVMIYSLILVIKDR